jgi:hypothetical protein
MRGKSGERKVFHKSGMKVFHKSGTKSAVLLDRVVEIENMFFRYLMSYGFNDAAMNWTTMSSEEFLQEIPDNMKGGALQMRDDAWKARVAFAKSAYGDDVVMSRITLVNGHFQYMSPHEAPPPAEEDPRAKSIAAQVAARRAALLRESQADQVPAHVALAPPQVQNEDYGILDDDDEKISKCMCRHCLALH